MPTATALVCTRNRAAAVVRAVASLVRDGSNDDAVEIIVVDQSDGVETQEALAPWTASGQVRYVRSSVRGKGAALNEGLRAARSDLVVCTDDDCEAPAGWVLAMAALFERRPATALVFCNVIPAPHDGSAGYVPAYQRKTSRVVRKLYQTCTGHGLGAGMAVRRSVVLGLGGFDEAIGPGARFPSGDDWDIEHRLLLRGFEVYETAELSVVHDGFRTFAEGRAHTRRDWTAIGAVCAKPLRAGHLRAALLAAWVFGVEALLPPLVDLTRFKRPRGLVRITAFVAGFADGISTPVDPKTMVFRAEREAQ